MEKGRGRGLQFLFVLFLASCSIFFLRLISTGLFSSSSSFCPYNTAEGGLTIQSESKTEQNSNPKTKSPPACSAAPPNSLCCDRTHFRTDVCILRGDVRTDSSTSSVILFNSPPQTQKIRPYTRKWETSVMNTVQELTLIAVNTPPDDDKHRCDVVHDVPAVVFSTGGYTGNVYHEFNDGIIPLFLTSRRFNRHVAFVVVDYRPWWVPKYRDIIPALSDYPLIDFSKDNRTHCFKEMIVGLRIDGELAITATEIHNLTVVDFRRFLEEAFAPHIRYLDSKFPPQIPAAAVAEAKPKIVIMFRNGSRAVENEAEVVALCEKVGFQVQVMRPNYRSELAEIYRDLNASDALMGVVGCALTHLLFMKPGSVFIQIVPIGTDWGANANFADPAMAFGLKYFPYNISISESSLSRIYSLDDPVLTDPDKINDKGWAETKRIYLGNQTVRIDVDRFVEPLKEAYRFIGQRKGAKLGDKFTSGN